MTGGCVLCGYECLNRRWGHNVLKKSFNSSSSCMKAVLRGEKSTRLVQRVIAENASENAASVNDVSCYMALKNQQTMFEH